MTDLILITVLFAFFGVALLFVKACERIVGPDTETERLEVEQPGDRGDLAA